MKKKAKTSQSNTKTSWGNVASWYDSLVEGEGSYQRDLLLPNVMRILNIHAGDVVVDVACGQGFFSRAFAEAGGKVIAADVARELIEIAEKHNDSNIEYHVSAADKLSFIRSSSADKVVIILGLQNIENIGGVFAECARILKPRGVLLFVLNHPAFRIPKVSSWGWDEAHKKQYRRVDQYLSESRTKIDMHPGTPDTKFTVSFHRPLQVYVKALSRNGFAITRLEEWNSHKVSEPGPRAVAENRSRAEIPLFLCIEVQKMAL